MQKTATHKNGIAQQKQEIFVKKFINPFETKFSIRNIFFI